MGPIWHGGTHGEEDLLAACYWNSLKLAEENGCRSIAFPAISTGVYGYPKERAAKIAVGMIRRYLAERSGKDDLLIILCAFAAEDAKIYERVLAESQEAGE